VAVFVLPQLLVVLSLPLVLYHAAI
jgi:hypothetical protein